MEPIRLSAEECADRLVEINEPLILTHRRPDGDTLASAVALGLVFEQLGKVPHYACADPIPERLAFIMGERKLEDYKEGYTPVSIDVASYDQLGSLGEGLPEVVLMIDHHGKSTPFAPCYSVPETSSAAEVLFDVIEVLEKRGLVSLDKALCEALYTAISSDTGCFRFSNAGKRVHELAARLIEFGIDFADINHRLFDSKTREQIKAESFIGSRISFADGGRIAYSALCKKDLSELGLTMESFDTAIDVIRSVLGVQIAFIIKERAEGDYRVSLRSVAPGMDRIAAEFGGGGHSRAAGCSIKADSPENAAGIILAAIEAQGL